MYFYFLFFIFFLFYISVYIFILIPAIESSPHPCVSLINSITQDQVYLLKKSTFYLAVPLHEAFIFWLIN